MIEAIKQDADTRMGKSAEALRHAFARIRTGRASPSLLDGIEVPYYGTNTPLNQVASVTVEDARTLMISPWEKPLIPEIEKAILRSDLGLTPSTTGEVIRLPLPALTEETRKDLTRQARHEAENARVAVRNIRRDATHEGRELVKEKEASTDEAHRAEDDIQKLTDRRIAEIDHALGEKESDLLEI